MKMTAQERFEAKRKIAGPTECWPWTAGCTNRGYGAFHDEFGKKIGAHVYVFRQIHGWLPPQVMHRCNNKICTNPSHLLPGNAKANVIAAVHDGLLVRKLKMGDIPVIRSMRRNGSAASAIAAQFGVCRSMIARIMNGSRWGHVLDEVMA